MLHVPPTKYSSYIDCSALVLLLQPVLNFLVLPLIFSQLVSGWGSLAVDCCLVVKSFLGFHHHLSNPPWCVKHVTVEVKHSFMITSRCIFSTIYPPNCTCKFPKYSPFLHHVFPPLMFLSLDAWALIITVNTFSVSFYHILNVQLLLMRLSPNDMCIVCSIPSQQYIW